METETLQLAQQLDFSMWALFARATLTVKLVMILLIAASFWSWSIIVQKIITFRSARREAAKFDRSFWSGEPLDEFYEQIGPDPKGRAHRVFAAGMTEWHRSHREDGQMIAGAQARIDRSMDVTIAKEVESLQSGLPVLATVGSTAPFVGLFGTVWGIMHAFIGIAESQNTNLAVVAPGRDPGRGLLQQAVDRRGSHRRQLRSLRRRVFDHPQPPVGQLTWARG